MILKRLFLPVVIALVSIGVLISSAQSELAAVLEVLDAGVTIQRVNTDNAIPINIEAIVGVGDVITTDATGRARITFFSDGVATELMPETSYRIEQFEGDDETFTLNVTVLAGMTLQQIDRVLNAESSYDVETPGMTLSARGTEFAIRVEDSGRSAMLVSEGMVDSVAGEDNADVTPGFGIRSEVGEALSDVVAATSFDALDSALDGCEVGVAINDDVRLNLRVSPDLSAARVGTIAPMTIDMAIGTVENESGSWYRIPFRGGFAWFTTGQLSIMNDCAGLRVFAEDIREDTSLYESMGDAIDPLPEPDADANA
ncbi:MAG: FecR domain-containing protein [Aggregatilineales bacterium]